MKPEAIIALLMVALIIFLVFRKRKADKAAQIAAADQIGDLTAIQLKEQKFREGLTDEQLKEQKFRGGATIE